MRSRPERIVAYLAIDTDSARYVERTDCPAAFPIFAETLARHCPTVSPAAMPLAVRVDCDIPERTVAIG